MAVYARRAASLAQPSGLWAATNNESMVAALAMATSKFPILQTSIHAGIDAGMDDGLRKITVEVSAHDLEAAQELTGAGVTETVRAGLKRLLAERAQREFRKLRGTYKFTIDLDALREDREW